MTHSTSASEALWRHARRLGRNAPPAKPLPPLLYFTDPVRTPDPAAVVRRLPRGAAVVFRAFGGADAIEAGRALRAVARARGVRFVVGADAALATRLSADGLHLPQRLAGRAGAIHALRRRFVVTAAAHDLPAVLRAKAAGVDAIVVSPVFPSASPSAGRPLGARAFAALLRRAHVPVYALGGINARTAPLLAGSHAVGLAAVDGLARPVRT